MCVCNSEAYFIYYCSIGLIDKGVSEGVIAVVIEEVDVSYEVTSMDVGVTAVLLMIKEVGIGYNCFK